MIHTTLEINMKKSVIKYKRNSTPIIKSRYNYSMCLYISFLESYYPIRVIKRITNENITD